MRYFALLSLITLSACGFSPVYGDYSQSSSKIESSSALNQIRITPMTDREGQFLRNALLDRFYQGGYPSTPLYELTMGALAEQETDFDITVESEATRRQLKISTTLNLIDLKTKKRVFNRPIYALSSYNILESEFATRVSEESAREAILNDLARQIEQQITLFLNK